MSLKDLYVLVNLAFGSPIADGFLGVTGRYVGTSALTVIAASILAPVTEARVATACVQL